MRLGCQLFRRGKRGAELTAGGARLLPAAQQMARWAGEFGRLALGAEASVSGTVRIAAPPGVAALQIAPFAAEVRAELPEVRLEVLASIEHVDLSRGVADLAVRTRAPSEPALMALHSLDVGVGVFAAPAYASPLTSEPTLAHLDWITWAAPFEHVAPRPMLERAIPDFRPAFASDNDPVLRSALAAGLGAMVLEKPPAVAPGQPPLVEIDLGFELPKREFHLVCAKSMQHVPRVRAVAELLAAHLSGALRIGTTP